MVENSSPRPTSKYPPSLDGDSHPQWHENKRGDSLQEVQYDKKVNLNILEQDNSLQLTANQLLSMMTLYHTFTTIEILTQL